MAMLIAKHLDQYHPPARHPSSVRHPSVRFVVVPIRGGLLAAPQTSMTNAETRRLSNLRATFGLGMYMLAVYLHTEDWRGRTWSSGRACKRTSIRSTCRPPTRLVVSAGSGKYADISHVGMH
jgi:hypothetical protein